MLIQAHLNSADMLSADNKRQAEAQDNAVTSTTGRLGFDRVAVGGTFDRLHAGHRILLAISALVARRSLFMGITGVLN